MPGCVQSVSSLPVFCVSQLAGCPHLSSKHTVRDPTQVLLRKTRPFTRELRTRRLWSGCIFAVEAAKKLLHQQHVEYFGASARRASMDKTQPVHAAACRENGAGAAGRTARILTWNINGLRKVAVDHGGLRQLLDQFDADICECCCYAGTLRLCRHANTTSSQAQAGVEGCIDLVFISLIFRSTAGLTQDHVWWKMSCNCAM